MKDASISIHKLTKIFPAGGFLGGFFPRSWNGAGIEALRGISLEIFPGEVFGLLGPNGAGKTTLLEILATLLLPTSGEARVGGCDVVKDAAEVKRRVGYCPSATESFYPRLSAVENLQFFALLHDLRPRAAKERIAGLLDLVGLDGKSTGPFQRQSHGMKQRLALARALLADPPVLLLDEPTKSLDPLLQADIHRLLRKTLAEKLGKTILMVTHSLAEAEALCDRIAILHQGRIVAAGSAEEVKRALGGEDLASAFEIAVHTER